MYVFPFYIITHKIQIYVLYNTYTKKEKEPLRCRDL